MVFLFALLAAFPCYAKGSAKLIASQGEVRQEKRSLKTGDELTEGGFLTTGPNSQAKVFFPKSATIMMLKENSRVALPNAQGKATFVVEKGLSRWVVARAKTGKEPPRFTTRTAAMGIRGTEFMVSYDSDLDETEVICFDGEITLAKGKEPKTATAIRKGQWGGLGGRFGDAVSRIIDLPKGVLSKFSTLTFIKTELKDTRAVDGYHGHEVPIE